MPTYRQYLNELKNDAQKSPSALVAANMLAAAMAMQWTGGEGQLDSNAVLATAKKLYSRPAFRDLMADEKTAQLMKEGKTLELVDLLARKENELDRYARPKDSANRDAEFLKSASEAMAAAGGAALERKDRRYLEMMKQIDQARTKAEQGIPLSGADTKALVNAVKAYNNGGTKTPGGVKKAEAFKESMCILKQFMPPKDFENYVDAFNQAHPKRTVKQEMFTPELMVGKVMTARDLRGECMKNLQHGVTADACAELLAIRNIAKKDPNKLISQKELDDEKTRLLSSGSALNRTLSDGRDRQVIMQAVAGGKANQVTDILQRRSGAHVIGAAKWRLHQSADALTGGPLNQYYTEKHLANVLVSHQFATKVDPAHKITNADFEKSVEEMRQDRDFQRLARRYSTDPMFRARVDTDLRKGSGDTLTQEYERMQPPGRRRNGPEAGADAQPQAQGQQPHRGGPPQAQQPAGPAQAGPPQAGPAPQV